MASEDLRSAVAAGALAARRGHRPLLQSIVEVGRAIFGARAASIMLLDEATGELVFEAVTGEGEDTLVGRRIPPGIGLAGWVIESGQPVVIEDVGADPRFAVQEAERTGYVPKGLMAAPLLLEDRVLGVLNVLDRPERRRFSVAEMELLGLFANQAAVALDLLLHNRKVEAVLSAADGELATVARVAARLETLEGERRAAGLRLLGEIEGVLGPER
ncbi:MAG TPA: GAF domain-containing protein [Solirubrobacteraceae bacterium]|nr:GAF domain-containing protein [Solirubrobacteraceae bacterium]